MAKKIEILVDQIQTKVVTYDNAKPSESHARKLADDGWQVVNTSELRHDDDGIRSRRRGFIAMDRRRSKHTISATYERTIKVKKKVDANELRHAQGNTTPMIDHVICPNCGSQVLIRAQVCPVCGLKRFNPPPR